MSNLFNVPVKDGIGIYTITNQQSGKKYIGSSSELLARASEAGKEYFFGQLWDGNGDGEELLESGAIAVYQNGEEYIVDFEILEAAEDILQTRVKVTGIN